MKCCFFPLLDSDLLQHRSKADLPPEHSLLEPASDKPNSVTAFSYTSDSAPTCMTCSQRRGKRPSILHICFVVSSVSLILNYCSGSKADYILNIHCSNPPWTSQIPFLSIFTPTRAVLHLIAHTSTTRSQLTEKQRSHKSTLYLSIMGDHSGPLSEPTLHFTGVYCFRAPSTTEHDCIAYTLLLLPQVRLLRQHSSNQDRADPYHRVP
jgi:hypothetical protein